MDISEFSGKLFVDPSFEAADPLKHKTVIRFDKSGYTIIITDKVDKKVVFASISKQASQNNIEPEIVTTKDFHILSHVIPANTPAGVLFSGNRAILIPGDISDKNEASAMFGFSFDLLPDEDILFSPVDKIGATIVYGVDQHTIDLADKMVTNHKNYHLGSVIIANDHKRSGEKAGAGCSVYLTDNEFFVHVIKQGKTCYFNSFTYKTPEEFVYYMVAIANTLEVPVSSFPTVISGPVEADSAALTGLREIYTNVSLAKESISSDIIPVSDRHKFHELTALISCE